MKTSKVLSVTLLAAGMLVVGEVYAGVYMFNSINNMDLIVHPPGFDGSGGELEVSVCIDPASQAREEMVIPLENAIRTWNGLEATTGTRTTGAQNDVPANHFDVETVLVHELGHCLGLHHPHMDNSTNVASNQRDYTFANRGPNLSWDLDPGSDGVQGSSQDERGDDVNLHWFAIDHNDPFVLEDVVDVSTYSVHESDLPASHNFAANANREVANLLGYPNTQSVMYQGITAGSTVRELVADDVAMILLGAAGMDRTQGTDLDYQLKLEFVGETNDCDITVKMGGNSFAYCHLSAEVVENSGHNAVTISNIHLGSTVVYNWYFNQESNEIFCDDPEVIFCDDFED